MNTTPTKKYRRIVPEERVEVAAGAIFEKALTCMRLLPFSYAYQYARAALEADAEVIAATETCGHFGWTLRLPTGSLYTIYIPSEQFNSEWEELPND